MIHSMTGFGRGQATSNGIMVSTEIKSVNNRYLDISLHIPKEIQEKELALKKQVQGKINRGKINIAIRVNKVDTDQPEITINQQLARGYKKILDELRRAARVNEPISLRDLMQFEEIFVSREKDEEILQTIWELSQESLAEALEHLIEMRAQEGRQLEQDLQERADHIAHKMDSVQKLSKDRAKNTRDELLNRINKLVDDDVLDEERLEMEVAILVDKKDITEELVRLKSHVKFFKEALSSEETVGRRLKFLAQEMNREINTIGSKADNTEISQHVVSAKESLEQIREQVANVE